MFNCLWLLLAKRTCGLGAEQPPQTVAPLLMSMDQLPLALLSDILSRVSSELLLRYRCVCKRWRGVVDDSHFRNWLHWAKEPMLLYHGVEEEKIYLLKEHEEAPAKMIQIAKFPRLYSLQGSCGGLLFFVHINDVKNNPELLINPLTKEILKLPRASDLQPYMSVYGFGFDRSTKAYKMVQINEIHFDEKTCTCAMRARLYNFEKRSWRTCKAPPPSHSARPGHTSIVFCFGAGSTFVFASGALNWLLERHSLLGELLARAMLSFDLTLEEFSLIPIPDVLFDKALQMHELGGSPALVHYPKITHIDVWVLKDYTSREWTRKYRIQQPCADCYFVVGPHKLDELILRHWKNNELMTYNVNEDRFTRRDCAPDIAPSFAGAFGAYYWRNYWCVSLSLVSLKLLGDETCSFIDLASSRPRESRRA